MTASRLVKCPRTPHLPWSLGNTSDDIVLNSVQHLALLSDVVVTEKLDGENTTFYCDYLHARSLDSGAHPSRDWVRRLHASVSFNIPETMRVCGENLYAKHSIYYDHLPSYLLVFAIYEGNNCLSWDETVEWCKLLELEHVPVLYRGFWNEDSIKACWSGKSRFGDEQEGYVVRNAESFVAGDFQQNVAKFVRTGHVMSKEHWMAKELVPNGLISS